MSHVTRMNESYHTCEESCHTYEWVISHSRMIHVTRMNESCHTCEWVMSGISGFCLIATGGGDWWWNNFTTQCLGPKSCVYPHVYVCVCAFVCVCVCACVCVLVCVLYAQEYTVNGDACRILKSYLYIYICMYRHICIYTCVYIYIYI